MMLIGWLLCGLAMIVLVIAALGVLRLPDTLARQHAATKAATLAVSMFALGLGLVAWASGWGWAWLGRLALVVAILLLTLPLASHALARAGVAERRRIRESDPPGTTPLESTGATQHEPAELLRNDDDV
jgi:multicomponent Na+:H+ antiporter subunit G